MKKICYITTISISIKAFFLPQLKFLADNGYDITVITSYDEELQELLGEKIKYIPVEITRGISFKNILKCTKDLKEIFLKEGFDLVQYSTPNASFCASVAAKKADIKIRNYHLMGFRYLGERGIKRTILKALEKITCENSTNIECVSHSNLELGVREKIFAENDAVVVWNGSSGGVDLKRFDFSKREIWRKQTREEFGLKDRDFVFGFVGRITKDKGVNEIFEAFCRLKEPDIKLLMIGYWEGTNSLDQELLSRAKADDRVIFSESRQDIERYYAAMDVILLPSYREGFGMVIAEAAAVGTPAIVSNIPGPIDVVEPEQTAHIIDSHNSKELFDTMEMFLSDRAKAEEMSHECNRFIAEKFDDVKLCQKILERKNQLLGGI